MFARNVPAILICAIGCIPIFNGPAAGQTRGGTVGGGTVPGGNTRVPATPTERTTTPAPFSTPDSQRTIFLSGKVMMDDGNPPPESVVIERVCNGTPRPETYTDSKGRFSFQLGQSRVVGDASTSSPDDRFGSASMGAAGSSVQRTPTSQQAGGTVNERDLIGCELRASLPGYRSDVVSLASRRAFDDPEVGTLILHRLANVEGTTISATSLAAPADARKAYLKGREAAKKEKTGDAQKDFEKAVAIYPRFATAWYELGLIYEGQRQNEQARKAFSMALAADSRYVSPYLQLGAMAAKESKWQETADTTDRALKLNPVDFPLAYFYNAVANYHLGKLDAAEKSGREAAKLDLQHRYPKIQQALGAILSSKQDYAGAAEQMKEYLRLAPATSDAAAVRTEIAELEQRVTAKTAAPAPQGAQPE